MQTALAFLQIANRAYACAEGPLEPSRAPAPGAPAFFAPDFAMTADEPWWLPVGSGGVRVISRAEWARRFAPSIEPIEPAVSLPWSSPDPVRFARGFRTLEALLARGSLHKGVPITVMTAPLAPEPASRLFRQVLSRVPELPDGLSAYGFYRSLSCDAGPDPAPEFLIGATPELLFETDDGREVRTVAVAGTRRVGAGTGSLDRSEKDRDEHQSVVDDVVARLRDWGEVQVSATEVRRFGSLEHLVAPIRLEGADGPVDFDVLARRLHPTPALGIHPRTAEGARWLRGLDPDGERGRFGAPFGLRLASGGGRCLVAIRNLQYRDGHLAIWAGCGVVPRSRFEDEWQEVLDKMHAVRTLWGV